jgi:peptidyl-prolyl cis-trans isomerase D
VNSNSDVPYDSTYIAKKDLPAVDADKLFNLPAGAVYGRIYLENTTVFLNL